MRCARRRIRPTVEVLEERLVPYALYGPSWANTNLSVSFVPDGTILNDGQPSDLFATLNARFPQATWQYELERALQSWAAVTPLNFHFVSDNGSPSGTAGQAQGDSRFGDIRIGAEPMYGYELAFTYPPDRSSTLGGDVVLNASSSFSIGGANDLYSVFVHEVGHALGLDESTVHGAVMYPVIMGTYSGLAPDDIAGIQALYGPRQPDAYDVKALNNSFASATNLTLNATAGISLRADLTTLSDVDYYRVTVPSGSNGTLAVSLDARNISLFYPKLSVYDSAQNLVTQGYAVYGAGSVVTLQLTGLVAGQTYTIVADRATSDVFGTGAYALTVQFGGYGVALPSAISGPPPAPAPGPTTGTTPPAGSGTVTIIAISIPHRRHRRRRHPLRHPPIKHPVKAPAVPRSSALGST